MFLPTADGGSAISDALTQAYRVINSGRALHGLNPLGPNHGAKFHFNLPGSVQGFREDESIDSRGVLRIENVPCDPGNGERGLALHFSGVSTGREARAATPTFIPPSFAQGKLHYELLASPTLYPGQTVRARLIASLENSAPVQIGLYLRRYGAHDGLVMERGKIVELVPGASREIEWTIPDLGGQPVAEIGVAISSQQRVDGTVILDWLTWDGSPNVRLGRPVEGGTLWRKAWVDAVDEYGWRYPEAYRLMQNHGTGLISQGTRDWKNYTVTAEIMPHLVTATGLAARVQGLQRYYLLEVGADGKARLVKMLDGRHVLAEADFTFAWDEKIHFELVVEGSRLRASLNHTSLFDLEDADTPLLEGGVGLVIEEGRMACEEVIVK
jgi:hypothetical protein